MNHFMLFFHLLSDSESGAGDPELPFIRLPKIRRRDEKPLGEGDTASPMNASSTSIKSFGSASEY